MKVEFTEESLNSLREVRAFLSDAQGLSQEKVEQITTVLLDKSEELVSFPNQGQNEEYLDHLGLNHKRIIVNHCKIIYRVIDETIYITDFFDTRQDPKRLSVRARKPMT